MKKPVIGVTPLWDKTKDGVWMHPGYLDGIIHAGGLPMILPLTMDTLLLESICGIVDGLLFTGGHDIFPGLYGEEIDPACGDICSVRDQMEHFLFSNAVLNMDKPAFGICRGLQLFNILLGGSLYQDLPSQYKGNPMICHSSACAMPSHHVTIAPDSLLHQLLKRDTLTVNSLHHQGICKLAPQLSCMAKADDHMIEAVYMPDKKFVWAVQWHPERSLYDEPQRKLFETFIMACI